jgi:ABC-type multidrug transport system ATPase subunit
LVNMLSGLLPVTSGEAFVGGYQLTRDLGKIQSRIGVCLQKDILWEDLTVEEHLLFYSRMKGIERKIEKEHVHNIIVEVGLEGERRRLAGDLSGGQKRRLSIAISLMGEPDVIFLDEPSSGLDPGNRRGLWQVIEKIRENRCLLLTTHSMEEAEALCTRIAIQSLGRMKTIGTQHQLKRKYGTFYKIEFITEEDRHQDVQRLLVNVNANPELIEKNSTAVTFKVSKEVNLSVLVKVIEAQRKPMHIKNWGFSESNLEDIFLTIVMKDEEKISLEAKRGHEHSVDNTLV